MCRHQHRAAIKGRVEAAVLLSTWPHSFASRFRALDLLRTGAPFVRLRSSVLPIVWSLDDFERIWDAGPDAVDLFKSHGYQSGVFIPVHGIDGTRAAMSWQGGRGPVSPDELSALTLLSVHFYDVFDRRARSVHTDAPKLSLRERQVLAGAANGQTSIEIGAALSLSGHTVNTYLNDIMHRFDCVNRPQLIAKALKLGLIH